MKFDELNESNYIMFAIKHYDNPQAVTQEDFYEDMKRFKWIKRLLNKYKNSGGEIIDNIVYDVDYIYHLFSADLGTRFMIKEHKFWMYFVPF